MEELKMNRANITINKNSIRLNEIARAETIDDIKSLQKAIRNKWGEPEQNQRFLEIQKANLKVLNAYFELKPNDMKKRNMD